MEFEVNCTNTANIKAWKYNLLVFYLFLLFLVVIVIVFSHTVATFYLIDQSAGLAKISFLN